MRPNLRALIPFPHQLGEIEARTEIGIDHRIPHLAVHPLHGAVASDTGIVHQDLDRPVLRFDLGDRCLAGLVVGDVELDGRNAGAAGEFRRRRIIACIGGDDLAAGLLQLLADRGANAALPTSHQGHSCHAMSS
jgi:hypothetical protein